MDVITLLVLGIGSMGVAALGRTWLGAGSTSIVVASLAAHVVSAIGQVVLTTSYYAGGDMVIYHETGAQFALWVRTGPNSAWDDLVNVLLGTPTPLPFNVIGIGESTGSMSAFAGLLHLVVGPDLLGLCVAVSVLSLLGKIALARALATGDESLDRWVVLASLLTPSLVFWTSGLLKESLAVTGLGFLMLAARGLVDWRILWAPVCVLVGLFLVGISKPYVLFAFVLAAGMWFYRSRNPDARIRPATFLFAVGAAGGGMVALGELFPHYRVESFVDSAAHLQYVGGLVDGGSNYQIVGSDVGADSTGQLILAPLALFTAMFRPLLVEATNFPMLVGALETTVLLVAATKASIALGFSEVRRELFGRPVLAMATVFVVVFGTAVGLSTTNLGTLSRYRVPMMPFLVLMVVALHLRQRGLGAVSIGLPRNSNETRPEAPREPVKWHLDQSVEDVAN